MVSHGSVSPSFVSSHCAPSDSAGRRTAFCALLLVALCWGASFPILKVAVQAFTPAVALGIRFGLAAMGMLWGVARLPHTAASRRAGVALGLANAAIFGLVAQALQVSNSPRVGFLVGTSVLLVPFFNAGLRRASLQRHHLLAAALSCGGLGLFSHFDLTSLSRADLQALGAAALFALAILGLHAATVQPTVQAKVLLFYQFLTTAVCWGGVAVAQALRAGLPFATGRSDCPSLWAWAALLYGALVPTVLCQSLLTRYQKVVGPSGAAAIFPLQSVFNYAIAVGLFGEAVDAQTVAGGCLILAAALSAGGVGGRQQTRHERVPQGAL
jgi:drug/metabolite transporter (DMT)-like permease